MSGYLNLIETVRMEQARCDSWEIVLTIRWKDSDMPRRKRTKATENLINTYIQGKTHCFYDHILAETIIFSNDKLGSINIDMNTSDTLSDD